jgi:hypothetical protein
LPSDYAMRRVLDRSPETPADDFAPADGPGDPRGGV